MDRYVQYTRISNFEICFVIMYILFKLGFDIFFVCAYVTIPEELKYKTISKCYLVFIIFSWLSYMSDFRYLYFLIQYRNTVVPTTTWQHICMSGRPYVHIFKLFSLISWLLIIYFMVVSIIHDHECNIYKDVPLMCYTMEILTNIAIISIGVIIICVIHYSFKWCLVPRSSHVYVQTTPNVHERINGDNDVVNGIRNHIISRLPISIEPPKEGTCSLCLDANENDNWRTLDCGHKYHPQCIDSWLHIKMSCPLCRHVLEITPTESTYIMNV